MASHELRKMNASGGTYTDTETVLTYSDGGNVVYVRVECMPFLQYWSCPDAKTIRGWVDELLKGKGMKRDGARIEIGGGSVATWNFRYYLKAV